VSAKIRAFTKVKGNSQRETAKHLGIDFRSFKAIHEGKRLPSPEEAERVVLWFFENITFKNAPTIRAHQTLAQTQKWPSLRLRLRKESMQRLKNTSKKLGVSSECLIDILLDLYLKRLGTVTALDQTLETVKKAYLAEMLDESPAFSKILQGQKKLVEAVTEGTDEQPVERSEINQPGYSYIVRNTVEDGPAQAVHIDGGSRFEEL